MGSPRCLIPRGIAPLGEVVLRVIDPSCKVIKSHMRQDVNQGMAHLPSDQKEVQFP